MLIFAGYTYGKAYNWMCKSIKIIECHSGYVKDIQGYTENEYNGNAVLVLICEGYFDLNTAIKQNNLEHHKLSMHITFPPT